MLKLSFLLLFFSIFFNCFSACSFFLHSAKSCFSFLLCSANNRFSYFFWILSNFFFSFSLSASAFCTAFSLSCSRTSSSVIHTALEFFRFLLGPSSAGRGSTSMSDKRSVLVAWDLQLSLEQWVFKEDDAESLQLLTSGWLIRSHAL